MPCPFRLATSYCKYLLLSFGPLRLFRYLGSGLYLHEAVSTLAANKLLGEIPFFANLTVCLERTSCCIHTSLTHLTWMHDATGTGLDLKQHPTDSLCDVLPSQLVDGEPEAHHTTVGLLPLFLQKQTDL